MRPHAGRRGTRRTALAASWQETKEVVAVPVRFASGTREIETLQREDGDGMREEQVAQIVHDLKSPLSTISLETYLLEEKICGNDREELRAALRRIQHNVRYLDRLVHDILDSCLIDAGGFELRRSPTEIHAFLEGVIDRAVPTRYRPRVFLEAQDRVTMAVDDLRIERVVANLLGNALKYAPAATGIVTRLNVHERGITVSVIDAGTSMTERDRGGLFEKYRRGATAAHHDGSGLGLYVSRRIIEAHGGRIDVECVRGIGTRFYFDLPW
jgi:signal transduction histidine kinase